jgi:uncharacterized membrane protein
LSGSENTQTPISSRYSGRISIKELARTSLRGQWNRGALVTFIFITICGLVSSIPDIGWIANIVISGPLILGFTVFFLKISRNQFAEIEDLFLGLKDFKRSFVAYLLVTLYVALWSLLLIVPGIIAALSYSLTFYLLADNPEISSSDAINRSEELMSGNKMELFMLGLSFLGWLLLCILTFGIGLFWLSPYINTSIAHFYGNIVNEKPIEQ